MDVLPPGLKWRVEALKGCALKNMPRGMALRLHAKSVSLREPEQIEHLRAIRDGRCDQGRSLEPFDTRKAIFIHIPRTGGTSIKNAIFKSKCGGHLTLNHYALILPPDKLRRYFKFCFVRNPWDRLVSAYQYLSQGGNNPRDAAFCQSCLSQFNDFDDFVRNWVTEDNIARYVHFIPQTNFITHAYGLLAPDWVARYETLAADYDRIAKRFGITAPVPHSNRSQRDDFRRYYTPQTRDIVARVYRRDIAQLNYTFD